MSKSDIFLQKNTIQTMFVNQEISLNARTWIQHDLIIFLNVIKFVVL
jgi:hypothetical protein